MHATSDCLDRAMFVASESYSGSLYEMDIAISMANSCDDGLGFAQLYEGDFAGLAEASMIAA